MKNKIQKLLISIVLFMVVGCGDTPKLENEIIRNKQSGSDFYNEKGILIKNVNGKLYVPNIYDHEGNLKDKEIIITERLHQYFSVKNNNKEPVEKVEVFTPLNDRYYVTYSKEDIVINAEAFLSNEDNLEELIVKNVNIISTEESKSEQGYLIKKHKELLESVN